MNYFFDIPKMSYLLLLKIIISRKQRKQMHTEIKYVFEAAAAAKTKTKSLAKNQTFYKRIQSTICNNKLKLNICRWEKIPFLYFSYKIWIFLFHFFLRLCDIFSICSRSVLLYAAFIVRIYFDALLQCVLLLILFSCFPRFFARLHSFVLLVRVIYDCLSDL